MKNPLKHILSLIALVLILAMISISVKSTFISAESGVVAKKVSSTGEVASKEEVIYANLATSGEVMQIYAVNILEVTKEGIINDYGNYTQLKNLTTTEIPDYRDNVVSVPASIGRFYYQGNLSNTVLPWDIVINYYLDGTLTDPLALAGKSGRLVIQIYTKQNSDVDPIFYENYLLQISLALNSSKCSNLVATGETLANSGSNKLATFTVMPGAEGNLTIRTDVTDFSMEGIQFSAVPFSMNIELPDTSALTNNLVLLADAIDQLSGGITELETGLSEMNNGAEALSKGSSDFKKGITSVSHNSGSLVEASQAINDALTLLSTSLEGALANNDFSSLSRLPESLAQLSSGLEQISTGLTGLGTSFSSAYTALDAAIASIPSEEIAPEALQKLVADHPADMTISQLIANYTAARTIKATYRMVAPAFEAINTNLSPMAESITTISSSLNTIATGLSTTLESSDLSTSLAQLFTGIAALNSNYQSFHKGLSAYTEGINRLAASYSVLDNGMIGITDGLLELSDGISSLSDGATELNSETKDMPEQINKEMDKMLAAYDTSDFKAVSFIAKENHKIISVQFVMKSEPIEKEKIPDVNTDLVEEENFLTRLFDLFR